MKTVEDINLFTWCSDRQYNIVPVHFVFANAFFKEESRYWIMEKLTGRFGICISGGMYRVAFEDPKEALFYDLVWG